jgi:hypothetical protein
MRATARVPWRLMRTHVRNPPTVVHAFFHVGDRRLRVRR